MTARFARFQALIAALLATAILAVACGGSINNADLHLATVEETGSVGPGDIFSLTIVGEKDIPSDYQVSRDGTVMLPFLKRVRIEGLEPDQIEVFVRDQLIEKKYLLDPIVMVRVKTYNSKNITILGMVVRPGRFPYSSGMTMIGAISAAGGFNAVARRGQVSLKRKFKEKDKTGTRTVVVNVDSIIEGDSQDIPLQVGDQIYVPERVF